MCLWTHVFGVILSFFIACGYSIEVYNEVLLGKKLLSIILFGHIISIFLSFVWIALEWIDSREDNPTSFSVTSLFFKKPLLIFFIILLCYLPVYLSCFPGVFGYDAEYELLQATKMYSSEFPMLHTIIYNGMLLASNRIFGNYNFGLFLYIVCQMLMLDLLYTLLIVKLCERKIKSSVVILVLLYCALCPVIHMLVVHSVRDVFFGVLIGYTIYFVFIYKSEKSKLLKNYFKTTLFGIIVSLTLLSRINFSFIYIFVLIIISLIVYVINKKIDKFGAIVLSCSIVISYILIGSMLTFICRPYDKKMNYTSMSLMSQCLARTYIDYQHSWSNLDKQEMSKYIDLQNIQNEYLPEMADKTRFKLLVSKDNFFDFVKFWIKLGLKYPGSYFDAIMINSRSAWFPPSIPKGYNQAGYQFYDGYDKSYFRLLNDSDKHINKGNYLPFVFDFYNNLGLNISYERIPIVSMIFSIGANVWVLLNGVFYLLYRKKHNLLFPLIILLVYTMIFAFAPLILLRYFSALFIAMPFIISFTLEPSKCNNYPVLL